MNEIRRLILQNKKLFEWGNYIVNDDRWHHLTSYTKAYLLDNGRLTPEAQIGVREFLLAIEELVQPEESAVKAPPTLLNHDLDVPNRTQGGLNQNTQQEK
jgi:hypothetical protein